MKKILILNLLFALILFSCDLFNSEVKYPTGQFPVFPVNLKEINSEFDDYNSDLKAIHLGFLFSFSSNRNTGGGTFDFVKKPMSISWSQMTGRFTFEPDTNISWNPAIGMLIDSANSPFNEYGPYSFGYRFPDNCYTSMLFYSSDIQGDLDIYYSYSRSCTNYESPQVSLSNKLKFIDSSSNEIYPSFYGEDFYFHNEEGFDVGKIFKMIYCSDKNGQYDIYEVELNSGQDILNAISTNESQTVEMPGMNSAFDDKCPFVNGKLLVFTSNRPGGYGGYDLYYSQIKDGEWSEPVNFGDTINTEYDEYRPITLRLNRFDNNLMIFSSNRLGGKGGFDLYYAGIEQMIE